MCSSIDVSATSNSKITGTLSAKSNLCGYTGTPTLFVDEIVVHVIANPNVLKLELMKGVFVAPGSGFLSTGTPNGGVAKSWCLETEGCAPYGGGTTNTNNTY